MAPRSVRTGDRRPAAWAHRARHWRTSAAQRIALATLTRNCAGRLPPGTTSRPQSPPPPAREDQPRAFAHACRPPSPAPSLNQIKCPLGIPTDSMRAEDALAPAPIAAIVHVNEWAQRGAAMPMTGIRGLLTSVAVGVLALLGCTPASPPSPIAGILGPGWNCLATPSAFDGPGVVFRVTSDGTKFTVADYSAQAGAKPAPFVAPTATASVNVGAAVVAQLVGLPMSGNISATDKYQVQQTFGGAQEVDTTDDGVSSIVDMFYQRTNLDRTQRYYLVRRAIVATSVKYDFDKDISTALGGDITAAIATIKPSASYSSSSGYHYQDTFPKPESVCIVAQLLPVPKPSSAAASPAVPPPDNLPLFIRVGTTTQ